MRRFIVLLGFGLAAVVACYDGGPPSVSASSSQIAGGKALASSLACASCHGADLSGSDTPIGAGGALAFPPNLTPDPDTGLGGWSDDAIARAVRTGVDSEQSPLCAAMPRFASLDDDQTASLVAYLRSLPAVAHDVPASHCAPMDLDDAGTDDGGVVIVTDDAPSCDGFADPATHSVCHACYGGSCQANGCYGGYYCEVAPEHCVPKPNGC